jgi:hypothetical protein
MGEPALTRFGVVSKKSFVLLKTLFPYMYVHTSNYTVFSVHYANVVT